MRPPLSDHFNGKTYFNPGEIDGRGWGDLLRWKMNARPGPWPSQVPVTPVEPPPRPASGVSATWIGHSTFLIRTPQGDFLTDPVFSDRASPVGWAGPRRVAAPGMEPSSLPAIDAVLLSHDHYDHCDLPSLRRVARQSVVLAPLGHAALLTASGAAERVVELDWWQEHRLEGGASVTLTPARHWCRRRPFGANLRLWGGFVLRAGGRQVYFVGDSGYDAALFREIRKRFGGPDLALIPIGAYEPRWFMKDAHMNPAEAVAVHADVGARQSVAMHWGTFRLTDEAYDDPPRALAEALERSGIAPERFAVLKIGQSIVA